jgi:tripartite-type tricarboxylate transporter receptor subunit TctC
VAIHYEVVDKNKFKDMIAFAKAQSNPIDSASSSNGSMLHLTGALFLKMAGIVRPDDACAISRRGSAGGACDGGFSWHSRHVPFIEGGKLRALSVTAGQRSPESPEMRTIAKAGVPGP